MVLDGESLIAPSPAPDALCTEFLGLGCFQHHPNLHHYREGRAVCDTGGVTAIRAGLPGGLR